MSETDELKTEEKLEGEVVENLEEEDDKSVTPWYTNTRIWILVFVTGIAIYWIVSGIMGMN